MKFCLPLSPQRFYFSHSGKGLKGNRVKVPDSPAAVSPTKVLYKTQATDELVMADLIRHPLKIAGDCGSSPQ
jgi:hypothetical protein